MFSIILTWVGAVGGIGLLVAMALGTFAVDFDDAFGDRLRKAKKPSETTTTTTPGPTVAPLG
jgi:hypothetical protein